jgi:ABC-2 type transport system permease protein
MTATASAPVAAGSTHEPSMARQRTASSTGAWRLVRLILRRDRVRLSLWVVSLVTLMAVSAQSVASMYGTPQQAAAYVRTAGDSPALVMFAGPGYGFDRPNPGVILVNETSLWMALATALMSVFLVNRHTRAEEESERMDLVRSLVVGRHAHVIAVSAVAVASNVLVGAGAAAITLAFGFPLTGTLALCGSFAAVGVAFAGVATVAAQVGATVRSSLGLATGAAGLAFVVRGIGDVSAPVLSWLTPFGWGIGVRAYAGERWWALAGPLVLAAALVQIAVALSVGRDLGSGLLAQRAGPATASAVTRHPLGLTVRLQRNAVIGWLAGVVVIGLVYGSVADDVDAMLADNPELADYLAQVSGASLADSYLATAVRIIALMIGGFAVSSTLRCRSEEAAGFAEPVLATPLARWRWMGHHLAVTVVATGLLVVASDAAVGASYAAALGEPSQIGAMALASLATLPALLVLIGVTAALVGWLPHATGVAWGALAFVTVVALFGTVLRLPVWLLDLSPLTHAPNVPAEDWSARAVAALTLIGTALIAAGLGGFRRRDITSG